MSDLPSIETAATTQLKQVPEGYSSWNDYWTKEHNHPWRTEPEIDEERQQYLTERRAIQPDVSNRAYPFKDIPLSRADIEWLLATHESQGVRGPVDWSEVTQRTRTGIDIRGANLAGENLTDLPLACIQAGISLQVIEELSTSGRIRWTWLRRIAIALGIFVSFILLISLASSIMSGRNVISSAQKTSPITLIDIAYILIPLIALLPVLLIWRDIHRMLGVSISLVGLFLVSLSLLRAITVLSGKQGDIFGISLSVPSVSSDVLGLLYFFGDILAAALFLPIATKSLLALVIGADEHSLEREAHAHGTTFLYANLERTHLEGSILVGADCTNCNLVGVSLASAKLDFALMTGANLSEARLDKMTSLRGIKIAGTFEDEIRVKQTQWNDVNLSDVDWHQINRIGDEKDARFRNPESLRSIVQTYRTLATTFREQGLIDVADTFSYREKVRQRLVLFREGAIYAALGSLILDVLSGYGYKPLRTLFWYAAVVVGYATAYLNLGVVTVTNGVTQTKPFNMVEALVLSVTSFHGRGFFPGGLPLDNIVVVLQASEAIIGLLIEIIFIATFTQRFFAR